MPVYIVRWPDLRASLIQADNEDELIFRLDEVADPGGCTWKEYDGPFWVDFEVPVKVEEPPDNDTGKVTVDDFRITGIEDFCIEPGHLEASAPGSDTAAEMTENIRAVAFPALADVIEKTGYENVDHASMERAIRKDLRPLIEYYWRHSQIQKRTDPEAFVMQQLGVTIKTSAFKTGEQMEDTQDDDDD